MGRKRIDIPLPEGTFTTRTLEEQHPHLSITLLHNRLKEWLSRGQVRRIGTKPQELINRKAWYLYERVEASAPSRRLQRSEA
jgi:hypothetical protein